MAVCGVLSGSRRPPRQSGGYVPVGDVPGSAGARLAGADHAGDAVAEERDEDAEKQRQDGQVLRLDADELAPEPSLLVVVDLHAETVDDAVHLRVLVAAQAAADPVVRLGR